MTSNYLGNIHFEEEKKHFSLTIFFGGGGAVFGLKM